MVLALIRTGEKPYRLKIPKSFHIKSFLGHEYQKIAKNF